MSKESIEATQQKWEEIKKTPGEELRTHTV